MSVTKTDFVNYSRCPRYIYLDKVKKERLDADVNDSYYFEQEKNNQIEELLSHMYEETDEGEIDLVDKVDIQLQAMLPYYKQVEIEAGRIVEKYFKGKSIYSKDTRNQECFDFNHNGVNYMCYVDIYNENDNGINIIEVKATTTNSYLKLGYTENKERVSLFEKVGPFLKLKTEIKGFNIASLNIEQYNKALSKLFDRYDKVGKYVYDLAIQRFIIEGEYKCSNNNDALKNIHYYLAVLNSEYIFNGKYTDGKPDYEIDDDGNELITFIDLTEVTRLYQDKILTEALKIEKLLFNPVDFKCDMGLWCGYKKPNVCKFFSPICGSVIPPKNSSLNYLHNGHGFVINGERIKGLDLINHGYINLMDIPEEAISNKLHLIQRDSFVFNKEYINKDKLKLGLKQLEYPIYHLDFETFPCPVPRFKGEKPYIQSPFEFSLHIEREPGVCDKYADNFVFLAKTHNDERLELVKELVEHIDGSKGTLFAQNVPFEKGRIKELAEIFPEYKSKLMNIYNRGFDLLWLVNTNSEMYTNLGLSLDEAKLCNYYHPYLSGSYSIKKTLPVFSDLTYANLTVKNGTEAIVEYANYNKMSKEEYDIKYQALIDYCQQDTWAMVVILQALRNLVN